MSRSTRLINSQIYIQQTILYVSVYVVCNLYVSQYTQATQTINCEVSKKSCELDFSWWKQHY